MKELLYKVNNDAVAEKMTEMLTDPEISTYDMFEDLVLAYENGNEDFRKGMDKALEILVWTTLPEIAKYAEEHCLKEEEEN